MGSLRVVQHNGLPHHLPGLLQVIRFDQQILQLQDAIDALCQRILIAIIAIGHGAVHPVLLMQALVSVAAVLNATI